MELTNRPIHNLGSPRWGLQIWLSIHPGLHDIVMSLHPGLTYCRPVGAFNFTTALLSHTTNTQIRQLFIDHP